MSVLWTNTVEQTVLKVVFLSTAYGLDSPETRWSRVTIW